MNNEEIRCFLLGSLISADYDGISEEEKQAIMDRLDFKSDNYDHMLEPIKDEKLREKYIDLLKATHKP